jgi:hypothetical protein
VVHSDADIVFVESHVRLLDESVLRWLSISGDRLLWQEGAELVHGLIVTLGSGSLVLFKFCLGKLCRSRGNGEIILLGEGILHSRLIEGRLDASYCWLGINLSLHWGGIFALSSWFLPGGFISVSQ